MDGDEKSAFNPSYIGLRNDILKLIPVDSNSILDVGCGVGALGERLQAKQGARVVGIEYDSEMARVAREKLFAVHEGDVETINLHQLFGENAFDCIILGDTLEHLRDPWKVLSDCKGVAKGGA